MGPDAVFVQGEVFMKQTSTNNSGTVKPVATSAPGFNSPSQWTKSDKGPEAPNAPAPPPVWTRYIDSRLKQFCTR
jgi:hypothetical protein